VKGSSAGGSVGFWFIGALLKQQELFHGTVFGMIYQLQRHILMTLGAKQGVFAKAIEETLSKRFGRQYPVSFGIIGHPGRYHIGQLFSHFLIADMAVQAVITDSLKSFGQDVLCHSSDELEDGEGFMLNLSGFMVTVPVADRFAVVAFNPSYRDGRRDDILCQVLGQSLTTRGHLSILKKSDKAFGIVFPRPIKVFFHVRIRNIFPQHFQEVVLPFFMHHLVGDIRNVFPLFQPVQSSCGHEDMEVGVIMAGPSGGLENNNVSHIEFNPRASVENIFETGMSCPHEGTEQGGVAKEPGAQELRHGQDHMAVSDARQEASSDEVGPAVGVHLGTGKTEAGFAGKGNSACFSTVAASVLDKAHLFRIAAVEHFLDGVVVIWTVTSWMSLLKRLPVIVENLLKNVFVEAFHGCSLQTIITKLVESVEKRIKSYLCGKFKSPRRSRDKFI